MELGYEKGHSQRVVKNAVEIPFWVEGQQCNLVHSNSIKLYYQDER